MPEAVLLPGASIRWIVMYQALRDEGLEVAAERASGLWRQQFPDRLYREVLPDDGRPGSTLLAPGPRRCRRAPSRAWIVGGSTGQISLPACSLSETASCSR
jgi:hypothetical protein